MPSLRRVGVIIDLSWAYQHHHGVFVGTQHYARACGNWECSVAAHADPQLLFPGSRRHYDGIIARATPQLAAWAAEAGIPLVNVYANTSVAGLPTVVPDWQATGLMAAEHLLARGFHAFAFLGFGRDRVSTYHLQAFRSRLQEDGKTCTAHYVNRTFDRDERCWRQFVDSIYHWMDTWTPPIGVFTSMDLLSRYLAEACRQKGLTIPLDAALIGCQNETVICLQPEPTLTSIDLGYGRVGFEAARILDSMMDGEPPPAALITVPPKELVPRGSTDILLVANPLVSQAMRYMAERGHTGICVNDVAEAVATSRRTLERRFREALGRPIAKELTRLKIERVKRLLVETNTQIELLARQSGFIDGKQLGKTFTRIVGVSPRKYRRQRRVEKD